MELTAYFLLLVLFSSKQTTSEAQGYRRNVQKNQASPGIYFDPETGKFKRGSPPDELVIKSQKIREEVKLTTYNLPFAKFSSDKDDDSLHSDSSKNSPPLGQVNPEAQASQVVYHHYDNPSQIILSNKPVNKYLKEHHLKYGKIDSSNGYDYHIGRGTNDKISNNNKNVDRENYYDENDNDVLPIGTSGLTYDYVIGEDATTKMPELRLPPLIPQKTEYDSHLKNFFIPPNKRKVPIVESRTPQYTSERSAPFYPTVVTDRTPIVVQTTTPLPTTTTTTTIATTTTEAKITTRKSRQPLPPRFPKYTRKVSRDKVADVMELAKQIEANRESEDDSRKPKYSYKDVPRYHQTNEIVAVRYPSDETSKFPHFPAVEEDPGAESFNSQKVRQQNKSAKSKNHKDHFYYQEDASTSPNFYEQPKTTATTTTTTTTSTASTTTKAYRNVLQNNDDDFEWGKRLEDFTDFQVTTVTPKYLDAARSPQIPTRGPVVSEGKFVNAKPNIGGPEWFVPALKEFPDPLLPPLMPGYGAPDLYGQDLRPKRKPNFDVAVTTYKPAHFVLPQQQQDHHTDDFHPLQPRHQPSNPEVPFPHGAIGSPYGQADPSRLPTQSEISFLQPFKAKNNHQKEQPHKEERTAQLLNGSFQPKRSSSDNPMLASPSLVGPAIARRPHEEEEEVPKKASKNPVGAFSINVYDGHGGGYNINNNHAEPKLRLPNNFSNNFGGGQGFFPSPIGQRRASEDSDRRPLKPKRRRPHRKHQQQQFWRRRGN